MKHALHCGYSYWVFARSAWPVLRIAEPVAAAGGIADVILVIEPDVEPDRRIECAVLIQAQPGQLIVKHFAVGLGEIAVLDPPIRDRPANAVNELPHGGFPLRRALLAVKVLGNDHLGGQQRPRLGHFDVLLLENDFPGVVGDFRGPPLPFQLVEGIDLGVAENPLDAKRLLTAALVLLDVRVPVTVADRRRPCGGAPVKTCSLATIMVFLLTAVRAVCFR